MISSRVTRWEISVFFVEEVKNPRFVLGALTILV